MKTIRLLCARVRTSQHLPALAPAYGAVLPGESVRWKTSRRQWLGPREGWLSLIAMTDEATGRTLARLTREDSVEENLQTLRTYVKTWGRPLRVRTDRSNLYGGQIRRALAELNIEWMPSETPRALGRSLLFFKKAHKAFPRALTSARVRTFEGAVRYLDSVYLSNWNADNASPVHSDRHRPLLAEQDLESIFSVVEFRQILEDGTIRFHRARYRIESLPASADLAGSEIQIERRADGKFVARWKGTYLRLKRVEKRNAPRRKRASGTPRKPRSWNRAWMNGFFDRLPAPLWKLSR
jgi:hypothetical protein